MLRFLKRISAPEWCMLMLLPLFFAAVNVGVFHAVMRALMVLVIELWYFMVFESFRESAAEYYQSARLRFRVTFFALLSIVFISMVFYIFHSFSLLSDSVIGIVASVSFFVASLLFVWQIVILLNTPTYNLNADQFKGERVKWLMAYLIAPIGVFWVMPKIKKLNK